MKKMIPYKIEKVFNYKGFLCAILFQNYGYRCGYVGIPEGTHTFELLRNKNLEFEGIFYVHGGVTFQEIENGYPIETPEHNYLWIGFDCAHYGDGCDVKTCKKYFRGWRGMSFIKGKVRTLEFCEAECRKLADQIADYEE